MNIVKPGVFVSCLILLAGLNGQIQVHAAGEPTHSSTHKQSAAKLPHRHEHRYQKPGAAFQFTHNYQGASEPAEAESVTLMFHHAYQAGLMTVQIEGQEGLNILNNSSPYSFALDKTDSPEIEVELIADQPGKYYLNIFATVDDLSGNPMSRVFALAFNVGEWAAMEKSSLKPAHMSLEKSGNTSTLILMPAEETISD